METNNQVYFLMADQGHLVPVEVSLCCEDLAAVAEEFFGRFGWSNVQMDPFVLRQVAVPLEGLAADVAAEGSLAPGMEKNDPVSRVGDAWVQPGFESSDVMQDA